MTAASEARRAVKRRRIKVIAIADAALLFGVAVAGVIALAVDTGSAQSVQADEIPQPPEVTEPAEVAGPVQPIFDFDGVTPWDPGKEPAVVGSVSAERPRTTSRVVRPETVADESAASERPPVPPEAPVPTQGDDPLHDDGEFGDGCEQLGTPERCDPAPVGLPPVVVVETPPVVEDEELPALPAEEEPPVDEVEVVEPVAEASA